MVEIAVESPRRFDLAPPTETLYPTDAARIASRKKDFDAMDLDKSGTISFDEWLTYAHKHIVGKVANI